MVAVISALILWRVSANSFDHTARSAAAAPKTRSYYRTFLELCRARGIAVTPDSTMRQLLEKFAPLPSFASRLQHYHYRVRYGTLAADAKVEAELDQQIRQEKQ